MAEKPMNFNIICRTCLSDENELSLLDTNIIDMLKFCISTEMNIDDLPKQICSFCMDLVSKFFKFKQECQRSEEILLNHLMNRTIQTVEFKQEPVVDESFNCDHCKEIFSNEENYMSHLRKHKELDISIEQYLIKKEVEDDIRQDDSINSINTNEVYQFNSSNMEIDQNNEKGKSKKRLKHDSIAYKRHREKANARKRKFLEKMTPEQKEVKRLKDREYYQKKKAENGIKMVSDMTESEKRKQRMLWRINSQKYREKKR